MRAPLKFVGLLAIATAGAPQIADAATLQVENGNAVYQAARGEINDITGTDRGPGFPEPTLALRELLAPVTLGEGCSGTDPIVCRRPDGGVPSTVAYLGNRDDHANINTFTGSTSIYGEQGDDDIGSGASTHALADGGPGDDRVSVGADNRGTAVGGPGDDHMINGASVQWMYGGPGDDTMVAGGLAFEIDGGGGDDRIALNGYDDVMLATGGSGDDVFAIRADASQVDAAGGDDEVMIFGDNGAVVTASAGADVIGFAWGTEDPGTALRPRTLDGGAGADLIAGTPTADTISGGAGADRIDAWGGDHDVVACGPGWDTVWADAGDEVDQSCERRIAEAAPAFQALARARERAEAIEF
jgi:Ca2+-binding RTX toxin-like protein